MSENHMKVRLTVTFLSVLSLTGFAILSMASAASAAPAGVSGGFPNYQNVCAGPQYVNCLWVGSNPNRVYTEGNASTTFVALNGLSGYNQWQQVGTNNCVTWNSAGYFDMITCANKVSQNFSVSAGGKVSLDYNGKCMHSYGSSNLLGTTGCSGSGVTEWGDGA